MAACGTGDLVFPATSLALIFNQPARIFNCGVAGSLPPGACRAQPPNATRLERVCVQSTSRSTLKSSAASGVFQQASFAKLLRLVFDTAALRGQWQALPPF